MALAASLAAAGEAPKVFFSLSTVDALPGGNGELILSVKTEVELKSMSISLNFDETRLTALGIRRILPARGEDGNAPPEDVASTIISNLDSKNGNQASEGWIHIKIDTTSTASSLGLDRANEVPVLAIEFQVHKDAAPGFSPVNFENVGPDDPQPGPPYDNSVEIAAPAAPAPGAALGPNNVKSGGINIVGEVGFMRGDTSHDRLLDITDPVLTLAYLFLGGDSLPCSDAADANDDGHLDITDPVLTLSVLFTGGRDLPPPVDWGKDPSPDDLGCQAY
jgi:hypothetical protein